MIARLIETIQHVSGLAVRDAGDRLNVEKRLPLNDACFQDRSLNRRMPAMVVSGVEEAMRENTVLEAIRVGAALQELMD